MSNSPILITQPDFDKTTRYISAWSEEVAEFSLKKGDKTITLTGKRVNQAEFESIVTKTNPRLIMLNGHGNHEEILGQDNETILNSSSSQEITKDRIIYALSCSSAKLLGVNCVKKGTLAFIG